MASKHSAPEIRTEAFIAAREKCALSIEALAHLACLSKKQIQQIENGQSSTFYSFAVKLTAAKKVAKLIQLDEKDAFDFGPQAELPFVQAVEVIQDELTSAEQESPLDLQREAPKKEAVQSSDGESKEVKRAVSRIRKGDTAPSVASQADAQPILVEASVPDPTKRVHSGVREHKSVGKKWAWLLPVVALVFALVQFQPLLRDKLDALMGKAKPAATTMLSTTPAADTPPSNPPTSEGSPTPAPAAPVLPVVASSPSPVAAVTSGCPPVDGAIESYKPSSASKPGNFVFVRVNTAQLLCLIDADGQVQRKIVEPGEGHSFYGKPPFKLLSSAALGSAEVFFQGFRIRPNAADMKGMLLVQAD